MDNTEETVLLDAERLRDVTMGDEVLMRDILAALLEDTTRQLALLSEAIQSHDGQLSRRLAHYSKGACANVGAMRAAAILKCLERDAMNGEFEICGQRLAALSREMELLRVRAVAL